MCKAWLKHSQLLTCFDDRKHIPSPGSVTLYVNIDSELLIASVAGHLGVSGRMDLLHWETIKLGWKLEVTIRSVRITKLLLPIFTFSPSVPRPKPFSAHPTSYPFFEPVKSNLCCPCIPEFTFVFVLHYRAWGSKDKALLPTLDSYTPLPSSLPWRFLDPVRLSVNWDDAVWANAWSPVRKISRKTRVLWSYQFVIQFKIQNMNHDLEQNSLGGALWASWLGKLLSRPSTWCSPAL